MCESQTLFNGMPKLETAEYNKIRKIKLIKYINKELR